MDADSQLSIIYVGTQHLQKQSRVFLQDEMWNMR